MRHFDIMSNIRRYFPLIILLILASAPFLPLEPQNRARVQDVLLLCIITSVVALALNVLPGYAGLLDLGIAAFGAIGAYTATILYDREWMQFPGSAFVVLLIGGIHAALWGVIRGAPTLRLTGDYYAIVTFAFAEIVRIFIRNEGWLTGGGNGYKNFPFLNFMGATLTGGSYTGILKTGGYWDYAPPGAWHGGSWQFYLLCLGILVLTVVVMRNLENSRIGRAWFAIKADETSAATSGINLAVMKIRAFSISAFFAGVGGALLAFKINTVSTNLFDFWFSIVILSGLVLGGMGSIRGVLVGTFLVVGLGEVLREQLSFGAVVFKVDERARFLMFGILLIGVMLFRPQGIFPRRRSRKADVLDASTSSPLYQLHHDHSGKP